jgi:hypothetical protein
MRIVIAVVLLAASSAGFGQTCQQIGNQVFCDDGRSANRIGNSTFYSYPDDRRARREGLPSSSTRSGSTRFYDNGATATDVGNTRFFSDGTTRQRIGDTDFYSNGKTCTTIGNTRFCN